MDVSSEICAHAKRAIEKVSLFLKSLACACYIAPLYP